LLGIGYWYAVLPFHHVVFSGMLRGIRRKAESFSERSVSGPPTPSGSPPPETQRGPAQRG
jgi:hypothetical protein